MTTLTKEVSTNVDKNSNRTRCEIYTRVMGYHRPISQFNLGKKAEAYSRKYFSEASSFNSRFCKSVVTA